MAALGVQVHLGTDFRPLHARYIYALLSAFTGSSVAWTRNICGVCDVTFISGSKPSLVSLRMPTGINQNREIGAATDRVNVVDCGICPLVVAGADAGGEIRAGGKTEHADRWGSIFQAIAFLRIMLMARWASCNAGR